MIFPRWTITDWSPCSVSCGLGVQTRGIVCRQQIDSEMTMNAVESSCPSPMPSNVILSKACQKPSCITAAVQSDDDRARWIVGTWSRVSVFSLFFVLCVNACEISRACFFFFIYPQETDFYRFSRLYTRYKTREHRRFSNIVTIRTTGLTMCYNRRS